MKKACTGMLLAAAMLGYAAPALASANDWIRYQEANDPAYNREPGYYNTPNFGYDDQYYYDDSGYYDYDRPAYRRPDPQDIRYCQHGLWVSTDQDCPEIERVQEKDSNGSHRYTIFTLIYRYFDR
jgi:hypothetical protein